MPKKQAEKKSELVSGADIKNYLRLIRKVRDTEKELNLLDKEWIVLRKRSKVLIDKAQTKNILEKIVNNIN